MSRDIMRYIILNKRKLLGTVVTIIMACFFMECSQHDDEPTETVHSDKYIAVSFRIGANILSPLSTRANDWTDSENHANEEASDIFENAINLGEDSGFRFLIFHFFENSSGKKTSLLVFDSKQSENNDIDYPFSITGSNDIYTIDAAIPQVEGKFQIKPDNEYTDLRIVVFANTEAVTTSMKQPVLYKSTWDDMPFAANSKDTNLEYKISSDWYPNGTNCFIPMYGWNDYHIKNSVLYHSEFYNPIIVDSPVSLLRAMAKLEIIDNIHRDNDSEFPKIEEVNTLDATATDYKNAFQLTGYIMPTDFEPMCQVSIPTFPKALNSTSRGNVHFEKYIGVIPDANVNTPVAYWRTYCPEQSFIVSSGTGTTETIPLVKVTVKFSNTLSKTYNIELDGSVDKKKNQFEGFKSILRNHIYRIEILSVANDQTINLRYAITSFDEYESDEIKFGRDEPSK